MSNTSLPKTNPASRQFSPLVLYHNYDLLNDQGHHNKQQCQPHSINMETRIYQHLARTNDRLERNAKWWADQENTITATYATLSDVTASHKKGFVNVILGKNETSTDQNENDIMNDITPSSSTSSTLSNSSSTDSYDSGTTTTITTPVCPAAKMIPLSTLIITPPHISTPSSPIIVPLEPIPDNRPPPPLYRPSSYNMTHFYHRYQYEDQYYLHDHNQSLQEVKAPSTYAAMSMSSTTTKWIASLPHRARSKTLNGVQKRHHSNRKPRAAADLLSPSSLSSPHFAPPPLGKKGMESGTKKRRRGNLPKHVTEFLKYWLLQHKEHPYPTERQKYELAQRTDLAVNQISNWFINARRRILHPMLETEQQLLAQQHHQHWNQYLYMNHSSSPWAHGQSRYYPSTDSPSRSASSTLSPSGKEKQQHPYVSRGLTESTHDTQHWSTHRTKLSTIEDPGNDQHLFATVS